MSNEIIKKYLDTLTLAEKAALCTGKDFWYLHGVEQLNLPSIMVTDGPHGLRKQAGDGDHIGLNDSVKATCFPTASGLAASWNVELITKMGEALGKECRAEDVSVLLGPGVNMKRNPLGGRNFEYFSEDPLLAGDLSAAWIKGVQSQGVGTSLKHYAVNNHEHCRMTVDAIVDQRTLREIYLPAFEIAVTESQPWTVMCSYNKINGTYAAENKLLLEDILREQWGFEGLVLTDWGANNNRVEGIKNGQNLEMPSSGNLNTQKIIAAVERGELSMAELDKSVAQVLELIVTSARTLAQDKISADLDAHHQLAANIAEQTSVLLKNDGILPVAVGKKVAVIGALAQSTRYQGAGSSKINPYKLEQPLDEITNIFGADQVQFALGYPLNDVKDDGLIQQALSVAQQADVVFLFAGLTPKYESEGFDRRHLNLPQVQLELIDALQHQHAKTVVVLQNGSPVALPFVDRVPAILESYLGGQAGASAVAKILSGIVNPSGKLAETFPVSIEDVPSQPYFPGTTKQVQYREGIWVGYRYFDTTNTPVLFPFGHGLSYTTFYYTDLTLTCSQSEPFTTEDTVTVKVTIRNTGACAGAEVVQIYVGQVSPSVPRPAKELKGYAKVFLEAGEQKDVEITLAYRDFSYWRVDQNCWQAPTGDYLISVGSSVADIRLQDIIHINTGHEPENVSPALKPYFLPALCDFNDNAFTALLGHEIPNETAAFPITMNSTVGDIASTAEGKSVLDDMLVVFTGMMGGNAGDGIAEADRLMAEAMVAEMPLRNLCIFNAQRYSEATVTDLIETINNQF